MTTERRRRQLRLGWLLVLAFVVLSVVPLVFILTYGYRRNQDAITTSLDEQLARNTARDIHRVGELVDGVATAMSIVGEMVEADPALFRSDKGYGPLWRAIEKSPQIDALYVSFEDGHHRVVTRIDDARRKFDPRIPANAVWHASYIDDFSAGEARSRHRKYFQTWGTPLDVQYAVPTTLDMRTMPQYIGAKTKNGLALADPLINPDSGAPVMSLGWPVHIDGAFAGFIGANMTLSSLSAYLRDNRFSAHSLTVILDDQGRVIAHPDPTAAVRSVDGKAELARVSDLADHRIAEALAHSRPGNAPFRFEASTGDELAVAIQPFPQELGRNWQIVIVAPTSDFVGTLVRTNRTVFIAIAIALLLQLVLIAVLSRYIAQQIGALSRLFNEARRLQFVAGASRVSFINELADLQGGFALLQNALSSFAKFVPVDVVTQFIASGEPAAPGVKQQAATIFFCDLEGFSGVGEKLTASQLLAQLTQYFAAMTGAIAETGGTIDKFIGDAVMAFWVEHDDHALRACTAAIRAKRRMDTLRAQWVAEGKAVMNVRIGLHSSSVLVGNIGSPERLSYTAIGDGVNVASRLEGMNKELGSNVCVSDAIVQALGDRVVARPLRPIRVKGRRQELMVYELLAISGSTDPELAPGEHDAELVRMSSEAVAHVIAGKIDAAADAYRAILARFPDDKIAAQLLVRVHGPPEPGTSSSPALSTTLPGGEISP